MLIDTAARADVDRGRLWPKHRDFMPSSLEDGVADSAHEISPSSPYRIVRES